MEARASPGVLFFLSNWPGYLKLIFFYGTFMSPYHFKIFDLDCAHLVCLCVIA